MSYEYVERYYGLKVKAGDRVRFLVDGREGVAMRKRGTPAHVFVKFDGGGKGKCHPDDIEVLEHARA